VIRIALVVLAALVASAAPAAAHVDSGAAPIYVAIFKNKPLPAEKVVALHASVTWVNGDKRAHRIASDKHVWPAFVLHYGGRHSVKFNRIGRYPYKVDGKAKGVIVVGGGGGGAGGGNGTTLIHYDVHVTGHAADTRTYTGETFAPRNGTVTETLDWDTTFANATLKRVAESGTFAIVNNGGGFAHGASNATYTYNETRGDFYGPCRGTLTFSALQTHLALSGSHSTGGTAFTFWSQLDIEAGTRMLTEINDRTEEACAPSRGGSAKSVPEWPGDDFVAQGLTFSPHNDLLELNAQRKDSSKTLWSPLAQLAAGNPFTIESQLVTRNDACGDGCQAQYQVQLHADVTRHR
jgi:plastocyanin